MEMHESDIGLVESAIEALAQLADMNIEIMNLGQSYSNRNAAIVLGNHSFGLFVKPLVNTQNLSSFLHELSRHAEGNPSILVSRYINPNLMDKLREANVMCLDTVGNAFIRFDSVYIFVKGNKPIKEPVMLKSGRAFQYVGLKVIFSLLQNPNLIHQTYREIAETSSVALGGIGDIFTDLAHDGYVQISGRNRRLLDKQGLLNKWVEHYPKLKKKHFLGCFTADKADWWKSVDIEQYYGLYGGEIAAEVYSDYLRAKDGVVFISKPNLGKLIKDARLKKRNANDFESVQIDIVEPFWKQDDKIGGLAPVLLVYADLINSNDVRNLDTAQRLYEQYLD